MLFPFTLQSSSTFEPLHGQASHITVTLSIDGGTFATATNAVAEVGDTYYTIELTTSELTCTNFVVINIDCTGAISRQYIYKLPEVTPSSIWSYSGARTVTNTIPTVSQIQSGLASASELSKCYSAMCHWTSTNDTLITYNEDGSTLQTFNLTKDGNGNITAITEAEEE